MRRSVLQRQRGCVRRVGLCLRTTTVSDARLTNVNKQCLLAPFVGGVAILVTSVNLAPLTLELC